MSDKKNTRPKGTGSIVLKRGLWRARLSTTDPVTRERVQHQKSFPDRKAADAWLKQQLAAVATGQGLRKTDGSVTLAAFLRDFYTNDKRSGGRVARYLAPRTAAVDLDFLERYVLRRMPALAEAPLNRITTAQLAHLFKRLAHGDDVHAPLAKATVSRVYRSLAARLAHAVKLGHLQASPLRADLVPVDGNPPRKKRILTPAQLNALGAVGDSDRYGAYFLVLAWTGLRPNEAAALKWPDVNLEARVLTIRGNLVRMRRKGGSVPGDAPWEIRPTKTGKERLVRIAPFVVDILKAHRRRQAAERLTAGEEWTDHDLVFTTVMGWPIHISLLAQRHFRPLLIRAAYHLVGRERPAIGLTPTRSAAYQEAKAAQDAADAKALADAGLTFVSLYELRHAHATALLEANVNTKIVSARLGHAKTATTTEIYQHARVDMQDDAVDGFDALVRGTGKQAAG